MTIMSYKDAINQALDIALAHDDKTLCYGLGVDDPKGVFGTTLGLQEKYGDHRVFDMPVSENAMTGIAIGASLRGYRCVLTHQRLDFALLSMDQIVNNAAKWHFMYGGQNKSANITIRMIIGRGWGQGPTHSQNLQSWFAHIPGLKVVMPASADDAGNLLLSAIFDPNPVIFLEHRWCHNMQEDVKFYDDYAQRKISGYLNHLHKGDDITLITSSYLTLEALHATKFLSDHDIHCDHLDLSVLNPIDWDGIFQSVKRTGRLLICDTATDRGALAHDMISHIIQYCWDDLKAKPEFLTSPDFPEATSPALTKDYHIRSEHIAERIAYICDDKIDASPLANMRQHPHDVPGDWFNGPF